MNRVADLHLHTTMSDGTPSTEEVIQTAQDLGLEAIALTDHDNYHENIQSPLEIIDGIDVISGIELRVECQDLDQRVDLLGYGISPSQELKSVLSRIRENRKNRAQHMIDLVEEETGVRPEFEASRNSGRPNIARAIDNEENIDYSYEEAFKELIGHGDPCYVSRDIPSFEYGADLLKRDCKLVSLAHPYRYDDPREVVKLSEHLDGIECLYDYGGGIDQEGDVDVLAANYYDLTITGGSDAHQADDIGTCGLMRSSYLNFLENSNLMYLSQYN